MTDLISIPPELLASMRRRAAINEMTNDEAVRTFWEYWHRRTPGRIDFVLTGFLDWRSSRTTEIDVGLGWLRPTLHEPVDAPASFQFHMPPKSCGAGVPVPEAGNESEALPILRDAVARAALMTDMMSFLTGYATMWRPAHVLDVVDKLGPNIHDGVEKHYKKYFPIPTKAESESLVLTDEMVEGTYTALLKALSALPANLKQILVTAVSWQAQANRVPGFSRYVHYWASVELLATYFWDHLPAEKTSRPPESEIKQKILENILDINSSNYLEKIKKSSELLQASARTQVKALARLVDFDSDVFFSKPRDGKNIYEVRNDIAHGNVANDDRMYADQHKAILEKYSDQTRDFVIRVVIAAAQGKLSLG